MRTVAKPQRGARRRGRPPGTSDAKERILSAAREIFHDAGYAAATVRAIAQRAKVDPALIYHYFGAKQAVFVAAMRLPFAPEDLIEQVLGSDDDAVLVGERLAQTFLHIWDDTPTVQPLMTLLKSAVTHERSAAMLREFMVTVIIQTVIERLGSDQPALRATLVASQLVGLAMTRYILKLPPLATVDADTVVAAIAPTLTRYLTGELHHPTNSRTV